MLKRIVLLIVVTTLGNVFAQQNVNNYKYVIVPDTYDFQHNPDEYQLNSLSQFLFNKYGFTAIMQGDEFPEDLQKNGCLALRADVVKDKGMFLTKLHVVLKNCKDQIVFEGLNGESREKKYKVAYNKALREAFLYVKELNYKYEPLEPNSQENHDVSEVKPVKPIEVTAETTVQKTEVTAPIKKVETDSSEVLYAQPINNGYQLVDSTPKVVYILIFSGKKDFFMVKDRNATVYKLNDNWVIAETIGEDLQVKTLNIKF
ncbi:hypothetical protein [Hanstruepera marina]|uniref:hypothetical protein n=1 Tax=Hanstruepera marina TaxID=2873265 RepID=UPI001CA79049|nr:hypothetical protein [Hanstruepera marina]